jgi:hypothetical protein
LRAIAQFWEWKAIAIVVNELPESWMQDISLEAILTVVFGISEGSRFVRLKSLFLVPG